MQKAMLLTDSETVRELKETAKWGMDREKKRAILALAQYGSQGFSAIQEVLGVTVYPEIKQACIDAIKSVGSMRVKEKQARAPSGGTRSNRKAMKSKKANKGKSRRG